MADRNDAPIAPLVSDKLNNAVAAGDNCARSPSIKIKAFMKRSGPAEAGTETGGNASVDRRA
jgi:hypothetical protein